MNVLHRFFFLIGQIYTFTISKKPKMKTSLFKWPLLALVILTACKLNKNPQETATTHPENDSYQEDFRPQYHFSPPEKWMNDPNGLVYYRGVYHLFYQYYPEDIVWGPMHWGHAVSPDLRHWEHKPIALYPDKNGYIFSGSAVADTLNTSGFGTTENPPLVAIFTYHDDQKAQAGRHDFQTQGIAYSLDQGDTWTVYPKNPVIDNTDIHDFRDPKVFWYEPNKTWILTLVAGDHAKFYASPNLIDWTHLSDFGQTYGAHGGVWECPDLFKLPVGNTGEEKWVLLISINPGAPHGGSGTQYFVGDFDGTTFTTKQTTAKWIDFGTDNYAGVTYNNTPQNQRLFIGWMSNWQYAQQTPTEVWRSAMTLPRSLSLEQVQGEYILKSNVFFDASQGTEKIAEETNIEIDNDSSYTIENKDLGTSVVSFTVPNSSFSFQIENELGQLFRVEYLADKKEIRLDRSLSGKTDFHPDFGSEHLSAVPLLLQDTLTFQVFIDWSSVEIFINNGLYTFTEVVFPEKPFNKWHFSSDKSVNIANFSVKKIETVW